MATALRAGVVGTGFVGVVHVHALRLLGVAASGLSTDEARQLPLDAAEEEKRLRLNRTVDEVRGKFGRDSLETGLTRFRAEGHRKDYEH